MTTQRNENVIRRQVFPIPGIPAPEGTRCITLRIPDHDDHEACLMGALDLLCKWNSWERDDNNNALLASEAWKRAIYDNPTFERCEPMIQFRQVVSCVLEASTDGGETWEPIFDASACANEVIIERIEDGTISAGGQPPAGGTGLPGTCYEYYVKLEGNSKWRAPIPVSIGDTITVSDVHGAWYDGDVSRLGRWDCPSGEAFALGTCQPGLTYDAGDPLPAAPHMYLIGHIASEPTPYFGMNNGSHNMSVTGPDDFELQANDGTLYDNAGSITCKVEICINNTCPVDADWTSVIDCTAVNGGFAASTGSRVNGVGWQQGEVTDSGLYYTIASIYLQLAAAVEFIQVDVYYDVANYAQINPEFDWIAFTTNAPADRVVSQASGNGVNKTLAWQGSLTKSRLNINVTASERNSSGGGSTAHIRTIVICGKGTKPSELP